MKLDEMLTSPDLSWKAKGLATIIAMCATQFREPGPNKIEMLVGCGSEAGTSIRSGLRELEACGLLQMKVIRNAGGSGHVTGSTWELSVQWPGEERVLV